jgi:hypothetical protein
MFALALFAALAASAAWAHGPQIQITNSGNKIVTRELLLDGPYSPAVTAPKSAYVMALLPFSDVWYSRPNGAIDPITQLPAFLSGPGLAYGSDLADGGPQSFAAGSVLSINFADGLKRWNGASFVDAGATQLKAFRGSNANITTPLENFGITTDAGPFDGVSLAAVAADYGADGDEIHSSIRFALLGDGTSPTSSSPDGVYSLKLQLSSTQSGLAPSDAYYFVLYKNSSVFEVSAAVRSLGVAPSAVQWVTPEPAACSLAIAAAVLVNVRNLSRRRSRR